MSAPGGPVRDWTRKHRHSGHRGHGWLMIACCIPMLVIALILVIAGVLPIGFLLVAVACTVMMAMMMGGMGRMDGQ